MLELLEAIKQKVINNKIIYESASDVNDLKLEILHTININKTFIINELKKKKYITTIRILTEIDYSKYWRLEQKDITNISEEILNETGLQLIIFNKNESIMYDIVIN